MARIDIWTDGSCQPNPGPGGWAAILTSDNHRKELYGRLDQSTNIRAEITAAIQALRALQGGPHQVLIHTDSEYVKRAIEGMKKPKANFDLLEELERVEGEHEISVEWVRGHTGDPNNERCDQLAVLARQTK